MAQKLKNKIAIVTGGNSGIGEATAKLFAQEGAKVIIMARRDEEGKRVENEIKDNWTLSLGLYPGIVFGIRSYYQDNELTYVLYIPFVDLALTIYY